MPNKLHVHNLDPATNQRALQHLFAPHGGVFAAEVQVDGDQSLGMVEMGSVAGARAVAAALHGSNYNRRVLHVGRSTAAEETAAGHPRMFTTMNAGDAASAEAPEHPVEKPGSQGAVALLRAQREVGESLLAGERLSSDAYDSWLLLTRKSLQAAFGAASPHVTSVMECGRSRWTETGGGEPQWERERARHLRAQLTLMSGLIQLLDSDGPGGL
jgi:hypothetical protein